MAGNPVKKKKHTYLAAHHAVLFNTGNSDKVDRFIALMRECGLVEVGRTGVVAIARGSEAL